MTESPDTPKRFPLSRLFLAWLTALLLCILWNTGVLLKYVEGRSQPYIIGWDQNGYFAWGRSLALDGDVNFSNDYAFVKSLKNYGGVMQAFGDWSERLYNPETEHYRTPYGMGVGLLSVPFLLLARGLAALYADITGVGVSPFAALYPLAHTTAQVVIGFLGLWLAFILLQREYKRPSAFAMVAVGFLGLNLGYYIWINPTMAHAAGFAVNTLFVLVTMHWFGKTRERLETGTPRPAGFAFLMGLVLGLACMVRNTQIILAAFPTTLVLCETIRHRRRKAWTAEALPALGLAAAGGFLAFLPQMIAWKQIFGSWLTFSYQGFDQHVLHPYPQFLPHILFGPRIGLFLWHPLAFFGLLGLILRARRGDGMAWGGLVLLALVAWIFGSWGWYWLGYPFGHRAFVDFSFFLILGLAEIWQWAGRERRRRLVRAAVVLLVCWNLYMVAAFRAGVQPVSSPWAGTGLVTNWSKDRVRQLWWNVPYAPEVLFRLRTDAPEGGSHKPLLFPVFTREDTSAQRKSPTRSNKVHP